MDLLALARAMDGMMAAFGKSAPSDRIVDAVLSKISDAPNEFAQWAADKISEEDKLPMNLAMAFRNLLPQFRSEMMTHEVRDEFELRGDSRCPLCHGRGTLTVFKQNDPYGYAYFAVCGCNRHLDEYPIAKFGYAIRSERHLQQYGLTLMDPVRRRQIEEDKAHPEQAKKRKEKMARIRDIVVATRNALIQENTDPRRQMAGIYR